MTNTFVMCAIYECSVITYILPPPPAQPPLPPSPLLSRVGEPIIGLTEPCLMMTIFILLHNLQNCDAALIGPSDVRVNIVL